MFVGVFETFLALLSLYNSAPNSNNNYYHMAYTTYDTVQPIAPPQLNGYYNCDSASGTAVRFDYYSENLNRLYLDDDDSYNESTYYIYIECGDNPQVAGHLSFRLMEDELTHYHRMQVRYGFNDIYNIKVDVEIYISGDSTYSNIQQHSFLHVDGKYVDPAQEYLFYTSYVSVDIEDFYYAYDGLIHITIQTTPVNDEEWSGTYDDGYDEGFQSGYGQGHTDGYVEGYTEANNVNPTANVIFSGILNIGLMPINFFLAILNFEVFGINIGGFVAGLLTIAITLIIIRMVIGGNKGGDIK